MSKYTEGLIKAYEEIQTLIQTLDPKNEDKNLNKINEFIESNISIYNKILDLETISDMYEAMY